MLRETDGSMHTGTATDEVRDAKATSRAYEAPAFEELGSFTELTQGRGGSTIFADCFGSSVI